MSILSHYQCVDEFHRFFGHPRPNVPQYDIFENQKLVNMRLSLIAEEFKEFEEAIDTKNLVEIIDALSDILYVVHGMGIVYGIDLKRTEGDDYDTLTPNTNLFVDMELVNERFSLMNNSINNLKASCQEKNFDSVEKSLIHLLFVVYETAKLFNLPIDRSFRLVHSNNMSKLCKTVTEAVESIVHYSKLKDFENIIVNYRKSTEGNYYVVFNETPGHTQNGKILKSCRWQEPDFTPLIYPENGTKSE